MPPCITIRSFNFAYLWRNADSWRTCSLLPWFVFHSSFSVLLSFPACKRQTQSWSKEKRRKEEVYRSTDSTWNFLIDPSPLIYIIGYNLQMEEAAGAHRQPHSVNLPLVLESSSYGLGSNIRALPLTFTCLSFHFIMYKIRVKMCMGFPCWEMVIAYVKNYVVNSIKKSHFCKMCHISWCICVSARREVGWNWDKIQWIS